MKNLKIQRTVALAAWCSLALVTPALAQPGAPEPAPAEVAADGAAPAEPSGPIYERGGLFGAGLVLGVKVGGGFSQVFSDLGAAFIPELELGWTIPALDRALEIFVSAQWAAPSQEGKAVADPRLPGDGVMRFDVTQQEVALTFGLLFRIPLASDLVRPYVAAGARLYLLRTEATAEVTDGAAAVQPFGESKETDSQAGAYGALGADLFLGPGALNLELQIGWSALDAFIMRDTNTGSLNVMVGYRFFL
jgi:hypothetical protein